MIFPETYFLLISFTVITIWLITSSGFTKKLLAVLFSILAFLIVNAGVVSYITFDPREVNQTDFTYSGNRIIQTTNTFSDNEFIRQSTTIPDEIAGVVRTFYISLMFISVGLFIFDVFNFASVRRSSREQ